MSQYKAGKLVNVPIYVSTGAYTKYDCVYVPSGINSGRTFISSSDEAPSANLNSVDYSGYVDFGGWYNVDSQLATINDLFDFSYEQNTDLGIKNSQVQLGEGYVQTFNSIGFNDESYSCKMLGATQKQAGSFIAFVEAKNSSNGFYFKTELKEDGINKYNAFGISVSEGYLNNFDLEFELKKIFKEDALFTSNQTTPNPGVNEKYDLMDFAEVVQGFDIVNDSTYYTVDNRDYAIALVIQMYAITDDYLVTSGNDTSKWIIDFANRDNVPIEYKIDRTIIGRYANLIMDTTDMDNYISNLPPGSNYPTHTDLFYKQAFAPAYNFLSTLGPNDYQKNVITQVNLAQYLGNTVLNRAEYLTVPLNLPYFSRSLLRRFSSYPAGIAIYFILVTNAFKVTARIFRKPHPTAVESESVLIKTISSDIKYVRVEDNRSKYNLLFRISDVSDFSTVNQLIIE